MKKLKKILLILFLIVASLGGVVLLGVIGFNHLTEPVIHTIAEKKAYQQSILTIQGHPSDFNLKVLRGTNPEIALSGELDLLVFDEVPTMELENQTLFLKTAPAPNHNISDLRKSLAVEENNKDFYLTLPPSVTQVIFDETTLFLEDVTLDKLTILPTANANSLYQVEIKELHLTGNSFLRLNDSKVDVLKMATNNNTVEIVDSTLQQLLAKNIETDLFISNSQIPKITSQTTGGKFTCAGFKGDINLKGQKTNVHLGEVEGNLNIHLNEGNIIQETFTKVEKTRVNLTTQNGSFRIYGQEKSNYGSTNSPYLWNLSTTTGDIHLNYQDEQEYYQDIIDNTNQLGYFQE